MQRVRAEQTQRRPLCCLALLTLCLHVLRPAACQTAEHVAPLRFKDGKFKVVQLTDMHLGESEASNAATYEVVDAVLAAERDADLIVLSGDMVSGFKNRYSRPGWFEKQMDPIAQALVAIAVPHAAILGNHDAEGLVTRDHVIRWHAGVPGSVTVLPPEGGVPSVGNYHLDVASEHTDGGVALRLWMLDSMDRGCGGVPGWGCVTPQTVAWLKSQLSRLPAAADAAAFIHIPVPEFIRAWNRGTDVSGVKGELTCCPSCNSGVFGALRGSGLTAIYSGHDHDNDFVGHWHGVRMACGRKTGVGSYGPSGRKKGARVIVFREGEASSSSETYLRLQDGSAEVQARAWRPPWQRRQWACEAGIAFKRLLAGAGAISKIPGLHVESSYVFGCRVATLEDVGMEWHPQPEVG